MSDTTANQPFRGGSRLRLFWALSRTPHGLLDMATPPLCGLLWLGAFPPLEIIGLGLITVFAGYTAVYALNDVIDYRIDRQEVNLEENELSGNYLDAVLVHHPMAQGLLSFRSGVTWAAAWGILALGGAFLLNPVCVLIFVSGCVLEAVYCLMFKVTYLRALVSGVVKTCGGIAAVYAVDPQPSGLYVFGLFCWLFVWEIGGQNIPADLTDVSIDSQNQAQTVPVRFGPQRASLMGAISLAVAVLLCGILMATSRVSFGIPLILASLLSGIYLLLIPAFRLYKAADRGGAMALFNRASYYPLTLLCIVLIEMLV